MYVLCLGMPCSGKTTFCREKTHHITFDFGSTWRREPEGRSSDSLLAKFQCALSDVIENSYWSKDLIYIDTYPEYINERVLANCPPIAVFIAIPKDWAKIHDRLTDRGDQKTFVDLYHDGFLEWANSWNRTFVHYKKLLINSHVEKIEDYSNQTFVDLSINNILVNKELTVDYEDESIKNSGLDFLDFMVDDQCFLFNR